MEWKELEWKRKEKNQVENTKWNKKADKIKHKLYDSWTQ